MLNGELDSVNRERPSNTPEALKALFYPGDHYGLEFVYPHHRATELAKRTGQNVLSMGDNMAQNMTTESSSATSPEIQSLQQTEVTGVNPEGEPVAVVVIVGSKPQR